MDAQRFFSQKELIEAHKHSALHESEIKGSELCGCFYCLAEFQPATIVDWIDDRDVIEGRTGSTALCPICGIDSVIGSASGYPIDKGFLMAMKRRWFQA
jgi:hypothetical protein